MRWISAPVSLRTAPLVRKPFWVVFETLLRCGSIFIEIPAVSIKCLGFIAVMKDLPHRHGQISMSLKEIRKKLRCGCHITRFLDVLIIQLGVIARAIWIQTREYRCARGAADRRLTMGVGEQHALSGQPVDVRRARLRMPLHDTHPVVEIIHHDHHHIRTILGRQHYSIADGEYRRQQVSVNHLLKIRRAGRN